jgi:hypothetical protein
MRGFDPRRRKFGFRFITFSPYFNILALRLQESERGLTGWGEDERHLDGLRARLKFA